MSIFDSLRGSGGPSFLDRLMIAQALTNGDYGAVASLRARQSEQDMQQQALELRQATAQRAEQERNDQVWGAKESGVGNPLIAGMSADDLSRTLRERIAPHTEAPGTRYTTPSLNGGADTVSTAPTMDEQQAAFYESQVPGARNAFVTRQAYGPPVATQPGGGVIQFGPGGAHYAVTPDGMAPQQSGGPSQAGGRQDGGAFDFNRNPPPTSRNFPDPTAFPGGRMTSGRRTPEGNRAVGGARNSRHLSGDGADYVSLPGQTLQQTLQQAQQYFGQGARAEIHNGTHVHVTLPGYGRTPYFGARGAQGAPRSAGQATALRAEAQRAIAAGADPAAVNARLRQMGVN